MDLVSSLRFFVTEALTNCRRAGLMTAISVLTITVALLLMGGFLLATLNVEAFLARLQAEAMITAFLKPAVRADGASTLRLQIAALDEVSDVAVVTPDEAAQELFSDPNDRKLLEVGVGSPSSLLPWTMRVAIKPGVDLEAVLAKLKSLNGVESLAYGEEAFRRFKGLSELLWTGSLLVILLLGMASLFIVATTVSLTLSLRREEIVIMRLVGATNWFIRWPFVIEGLIHGVVGAALASFLLLVSGKFVLARLAVFVPFFAFDVDLAHLLKLSVKLLMMGVVLGVSGALLSLRDLRSFSRRD